MMQKPEDCRYFYPRSPRGGRLLIAFVFFAVRVFLSTPSARRATRVGDSNGPDEKNFYPRPPRGGRRAGRNLACGEFVISIHALREEGDPPEMGSMPDSRSFLSTPSARRATQAGHGSGRQG